MLSTYRTCIALIEKPNKTPSYLSFEITGPEVCAIWYTETEVNLYKKNTNVMFRAEEIQRNGRQIYTSSICIGVAFE